MRRVAAILVGSLFPFFILACGGNSPKSFTLTASPATSTLTPGAAGQAITLSVAAVNGFNQSVSVAVSGLPAGVTASPATATLTPGAAAQSMTITAASTAAAGAATITFTGTSGALTTAATVALTVNAPPPPPNFSLSLTPTSLSLTAGGAGSQISVLATPSNSFTGAVAVAISGLPAGVTANPATLSLTPGTPQTTTLTASASAAAGASTVTFTGTNGTLSNPATLALTVQAAAQPAIADVTTYHYDNARDGLNANETILTPANVNSNQFGLLRFQKVDGNVDGEPLFVAGISVGGKTRNVLYVTTENDSVYAFDADSGDQLWKTSVLGSGETVTAPIGNCGQITPTIGITSTPVIDRKQGPNGTLFTVGMTTDAGGSDHHRLHALDLTTGAEIGGSPTEITASYPGAGANTQGGNVVFDPKQYTERAAILLLNGTVYLSWTSHCDALPYTGWIMGYSESTLQQTQLINVTPNGSYGSIWMSGDGPAADNSGNIYFLDANGTFDTTLTATGFPSQGDFGNAMIKLSTTGGKLAVADYFNTYNTVAQSAVDTDLGSGGEILLPDMTDSSGTVHQLIVGAGKDMNIYIADRNNMGKYNGNSDSNIYQMVSGQLTGMVYATPAYFKNNVYYGAVNDHLKAFPITNAQLATAPSSLSTNTFPYPGATPSVSANGTTNGIVWALESTSTSPAVLHAYDATNLATELYNSNQAASGRDSFGQGNKYITPLIINAKVYVGGQSGFAVFGLLPQ